jgi:hypothetical protein
VIFLFVIIVSHCQMKESIPVTQLVRETATVMQEFTQSGYVSACLFYCCRLSDHDLALFEFIDEKLGY